MIHIHLLTFLRRHEREDVAVLTMGYVELCYMPKAV